MPAKRSIKVLPLVLGVTLSVYVTLIISLVSMSSVAPAAFASAIRSNVLLPSVDEYSAAVVTVKSV